MRRMIRWGWALVGVLLLRGPDAWSQAGGEAALFHQGRTRLSVSGGYGAFNNKSYAILGLGAGYYLWDGLQAGVDGEAWMGSRPHLYTISPQLTYVLVNSGEYKPYFGGFYRHTFQDIRKDLDSAGARAGVVLPLSTYAYLNAGLVYENYFHCDKTLYARCSEVYPELGFSFTY